MTAVTAAPARTASHAGYPGSLRSETIKFTGLRSPWILLSIAFVLQTGLSVLIVWGASSSARNPELSGGDTSIPAEITTIGFFFAQLLLVALGGLFASTEWQSGAVRTSILAVDRRWQFLAGKATVLALASGTVAFVSLVLTMVIGIPICSGLDFDPFGPDGRRLLYLVPLVAALVTLLGLGLGLLLRNSAGAIVIGIGVVLVLPFTLMIASNWSETIGDVSQYLPFLATNTLFTAEPDEDAIGHVAAFFTMIGWTLLPLVPGAYRLLRSDV